MDLTLYKNLEEARHRGIVSDEEGTVWIPIRSIWGVYLFHAVVDGEDRFNLEVTWGPVGGRTPLKNFRNKEDAVEVASNLATIVQQKSRK